METCIGDLRRVLELLRSVPIGHVELVAPFCIREASSPEFLGRLVAPSCARAADVAVERASIVTYTHGRGVSIVANVTLVSEPPPESLGAVLDQLEHHTRASLSLSNPAVTTKLAATIRRGMGSCIDIAVTVPAGVTPGSTITVHSITVAGEALPLDRLLPAIPVMALPPELTAAQMLQLQEWLGNHAGAWQEVYRGSRDGFGAADFHAKCDHVPRLLVLACTAKSEKDSEWLFGGFTEKGFVPSTPGRRAVYDDPAAFLFSLTNPAGKPTKLPSAGAGQEINYDRETSAKFGAGPDLRICDNSSTTCTSRTFSGEHYTCAFVPLRMNGEFPLATGAHAGCLMAEVVAFAISDSTKATQHVLV